MVVQLNGGLKWVLEYPNREVVLDPASRVALVTRPKSTNRLHGALTAVHHRQCTRKCAEWS